MIATDRLTQVFVEVADTLVNDFDIVDFLHNLTLHAAEVSGAASVGLLLSDQRGQLRFMASSDEKGRLLELFQLQEDEGPCLDCVQTKQPVVNADLESASDRWPTFAPAARAAGYQSVHALPMRLRDDVIGALNLFGNASAHFEDDEIRIVQALADVATIAILQERAIARSHVLTEQLQGALNSRIVIEQAKGALAQLEGATPSEAFELMRSQARSTGRRLVDVATDVLDQIADRS